MILKWTCPKCKTVITKEGNMLECLKWAYLHNKMKECVFCPTMLLKPYMNEGFQKGLDGEGVKNEKI